MMSNRERQRLVALLVLQKHGVVGYWKEEEEKHCGAGNDEGNRMQVRWSVSVVFDSAVLNLDRSTEAPLDL